MRIEGATALVTGANRGLGEAYAQALLEAGAAKVYAAARDPAAIADPRLVPIRLDVTSTADIIQSVRVSGGRSCFSTGMTPAARDVLARAPALALALASTGDSAVAAPALARVSRRRRRFMRRPPRSDRRPASGESRCRCGSSC